MPHLRPAARRGPTPTLAVVALLVVAGACHREPRPEIEVGETITTTSTDDTTTTLRRGPAPGWEPARPPSSPTTKP